MQREDNSDVNVPEHSSPRRDWSEDQPLFVIDRVPKYLLSWLCIMHLIKASTPR